MSCASAASRMVRLSRKTWSASASGSPWRRLISICAAPFLVDQGVDLQLLGLGEGVDVLEDGVELVDRRDRIGAAPRLGAARAADRRLQRIVRIGVALDEVELDLRRHHRGPALLVIEGDDALEHLARGDLDRRGRRDRGRRGSPGRSGRAPRAPRTGSRSRAAARCRRPRGRSGSPPSPPDIRRRWSA